jgi:hypothetical protein
MLGTTVCSGSTATVVSLHCFRSSADGAALIELGTGVGRKWDTQQPTGSVATSSRRAGASASRPSQPVAPTGG